MSAITKMLIVLQLVFSLVVAVLLVLFISKTEDSKAKLAAMSAQAYATSAQLVAEQQKVVAANSQNSVLEANLADLQHQATAAAAAADKDKQTKDAQLKALQTELTNANTNNKLLTNTINTLGELNKAKDTELAALRTQNPELVKQNGQLIRANQELSNQLNAATLSIKSYQEMLAKAPAGSAGNVSPGMVPPQITTYENTPAVAAKVNGQVTDVTLAAGRTHFEMPLGTRDGISVGTKMFVYRGNGYVGDATVEAVTPEKAVAVVITTKAGETVQVGDYVSTLGQ